jgi:hypothetical protein
VKPFEQRELHATGTIRPELKVPHQKAGAAKKAAISVARRNLSKLDHHAAQLDPT